MFGKIKFKSLMLILSQFIWFLTGLFSIFVCFCGKVIDLVVFFFLKKNKGTFLLNNKEINANDTWIKNGKRVVQLVQGKGDDIDFIMCIVGNGMVEIPGMLEQGKWR